MLHRARVLPNCRVEELDMVTIQRIIGEVRTFSIRWLSKGKAPASIIYNKTACGECGGSVQLQKLGEGGLPRATFWCKRCCSQGAPAQHCSSGSTISLTQSRVSPFLQSPGQTDFTTRAGNSEGVVFYGDASLDVPRRLVSGATKRKPTIGSERLSKRACATPQSVAATGTPAGNPLGSTVRVASVPLGVQNKICAVPADLHASQQPLCVSCEKHGTSKLALKRVRKQGANTCRLFFSCRGPGCSFFKWADTQFPLCSCPSSQQHAVLRVSKKETSGGRWFFACRGDGAAKRCNYFAWASPSQLQPLQGLLSPLT